jgi:hypothetical protein
MVVGMVASLLICLESGCDILFITLAFYQLEFMDKG